MKRAIYLYVGEGGEPQAMNYSSIGESQRRDGIQSVQQFMESQRGITIDRVERGNGAARHWACIVTDQDGLIAAAKTANIKIA